MNDLSLQPSEEKKGGHIAWYIVITIRWERGARSRVKMQWHNGTNQHPKHGRYKQIVGMQHFLHEQTMRSWAARAVCCCCGSHRRSATSLKAPVHSLHDTGRVQDTNKCSEPFSTHSSFNYVHSVEHTVCKTKIGQLMSKRESELFQSLTNVNISSQNVVHNAIWLLGSALKPARNVHFLHAIFKKTAIFHPITSIFHIKRGQSQMVWNLTTYACPALQSTYVWRV